MATSTNQKPTIYHNLYENTSPDYSYLSCNADVSYDIIAMCPGHASLDELETIHQAYLCARYACYIHYIINTYFKIYHQHTDWTVIYFDQHEHVELFGVMSYDTKGFCQVEKNLKSREKLGLARPQTPTPLSTTLLLCVLDMQVSTS